MRLKSSRAELLGAAAAIAGSIGLLVAWHVANHAFPEGDNAEYMWVALHVYRKFITSGFFHGLHAAYTFRIWKPILHPLLAVPGLFLAGGSVLAAQAFTVIPLYALLALAVYGVARRYLRRIDSVLTAAFVLNLRLLLGEAYQFTSELPFTLFYFSSLYFLLRSQGFSRRLPGLLAAACIALAICIRPAEALVLLFFPLVGYIAFSVRAKAVSVPDLLSGIAVAVLAVLPAITFLLSGRNRWYPEGDFVALAVGLTGPILAALVHRFILAKRGNSSFQLAVLVAATLVLLWFGGFLHPVIDWVAAASFQSSPANSPERIGFAKMLANLSEAMVGISGPWLFGIAVGVGAIGYRSVRAKPDSRTPSLSWAVLPFILMAGFHYVLGSRSYNPNPRYYALDFVALYFAALLIFFRPQKLVWLRRAAVLAILVLAVTVRLSEYQFLHERFESLESWVDFGQAGMIRPWRHPDPGNLFFDQIEPWIKKDGVPRVMVYPTIGDWPITWFFEGLSMRLISLSRGHEIFAEYPRPYLFEKWPSWLHRDGSKFDYYVVGPLENADPALVPDIEREPHGEIHRFSVKYDPERSPATFLWISAK